MIITLEKPVQLYGTLYKAGEEVEVNEEIFDWLNNQYISERLDLGKLIDARRAELAKFTQEG